MFVSFHNYTKLYTKRIKELRTVNNVQKTSWLGNTFVDGAR